MPVQEFSESEWVKRYGHARLKYWEERLRKNWMWSTSFWQWSAQLSTLAGGLLAVFLLLERVWLAATYSWAQVGW